MNVYSKCAGALQFFRNSFSPSDGSLKKNSKKHR
jgi:hypothetical protein